VRNWGERASTAGAHHSEEICYVDHCDGGFYTLTAKLPAESSRLTEFAHLSFSFRGHRWTPGSFTIRFPVRWSQEAKYAPSTRRHGKPIIVPVATSGRESAVALISWKKSAGWSGIGGLRVGVGVDFAVD
jgi:hypothetical protein